MRFVFPFFRPFVLMTIMAWGSSFVASAQDRAFVLCEGAQDFYSGDILESPRVGAIDLTQEEPGFEVLHVFEGQGFASDLVVNADGTELYVAADDVVYRLDAQTGSVLAEQPLQGARRLALEGARLFVSRGDYDPMTWTSVPFDHYLVALDAESLAWDAGWVADGAAGPAWASEGLCVDNGGLFVGINNAFAYGEEVGLIGRVDLVSGAYSEVDLGEDGLNPVHLFAAEGGGVVSVNARQYDGTSLSRREEGGAVMTAVVADVTAGCGAAAWHDGGVLYQVYGEAGFRKADGQSLEAAEGWTGNGNPVYSMAIVPQGQALLGMTDFATSGSVELWGLDGDMVWSLEVGISPGRIVVVSGTSDVPDVSAPRGTVVGTFDLLGRPMASGATGMAIQLWSDGRVTKTFRTAD
jgi:hypothetical protein